MPVHCLFSLFDPGPKGATPSLGYYIVMIPFPLLVLIASWHFNKKARASIQQSEMTMCVFQKPGGKEY
jgi:hypothetical protein